ncbi:MAG: site-2 protease family protein [Armatimonadetes bacterium]|nr:site-2 protease family protein [Armatimonadota bacterium]MDW8121292.1 site-2 protease family protein [Armatimonadota bacterium]
MAETILESPIFRVLIWLIPFVLAFTIHEAAHAWAAWKLGDPTPVYQGRLTLNPIAHIDPLGALMFLLSAWAGIGFGWAKPVIVNPMNFRHYSRDMALVAAAGPASNVVQALGWAILLSVFASFARLLPFLSQPLGILGYLAAGGIFINLGLAAFNLIPIPPLDGSRILRMFLPTEWRWRMDTLERSGLGFLLLFVLLAAGVLRVIWGPVDAIGDALIRLATGI